LADCHHVLEEKWWIYLVRSLGFQPEPSSHDWHVQPSCQRTDPLPPERALSVQSRPALTRASRAYTNLPVLETCTNYASYAATVNPLGSQDFHLFSTTGELTRNWELVIPNGFSREESAFGSLSARDRTHLPHRTHAISAQAEAEDHEFDKRSLGGSCQCQA
jgi:hypothetical protein